MSSQVIAFLAIISVLQSISYTQIGPFYPFEAASKGITEITIGVIMGSFSILYIISAIMCGKYLSQIGKENGIKFGMLLIVVQLFGLSVLKYVESPHWFVALSILAMCFGGAGAAINFTCALAIITSIYPDERETNIGILEGASGLGLLIGPLLGSALYTLGGYSLPFWTIGTLSLLLFPVIKNASAVVKSEEEKLKLARLSETAAVEDDESIELQRGSTMGSSVQIGMDELKRVPMFWFGVIAQVLVFAGIAFGLPIFALHLASYEGFSREWVGFYFAAPAITYIVNSVLIGAYCKVMSRKMVICIGLFLFALSFYLIGTSPMLGIDDNSRIILVGLFLFGFSCVMITVPILPEVLDSISRQLPHLQGEELNNVISGYFNSCIGIGEAIGPITAGMLTEAFGFRTTFDITATCLLAYAFVFFVATRSMVDICEDPNKEEDIDEYIRS